MGGLIFQGIRLSVLRIMEAGIDIHTTHFDNHTTANRL
jgi:hypothetical protein